MLVDGFTIGAQALNFLLLVLLMRRFLYRPVLDAIDARAQRVATKSADTEDRHRAAVSKQAEYERKLAELDAQCGALLEQAKTDADAVRSTLLAGARDEAVALKAAHAKVRHDEAHAMHRDIVRQTQDEVFAIARRVLGDLASARLEATITDAFMHRLRTMDEAVKAALITAPGTLERGFRIRTRFPIEPAQQSALGVVIQHTFATEDPTHFEVAESVIGGIELIAGGQRISWSIADYLETLALSVDRRLSVSAPTARTVMAPDCDAD
jgi:F-type H+-transporting ATPase subunit b